MITPEYDVSIIIPAKNGDKTIKRVLSAIYSQSTKLKFEVLVIDSGSTDHTLKILNEYPVKLQQIPEEQFSHSGTRNLGASLATGTKYLIFLNQDAVPADELWLDNMVLSLKYRHDLKAVCAMELNERAQYFNVAGVAAYVFKNSAAKGVYVIEPFLLDKKLDLPKNQVRWLFPFSTVCAIFEKDHFNKNPFNELVEWGEDLEWAVRNSNAGFALACSSLAQVFHYHDYSEQEYEQIMIKTEKLYKKLFGFSEDNSAGSREAGACSSCFEYALRLQTVYNSVSWRVTKPLRSFGDLIRGMRTGKR